MEILLWTVLTLASLFFLARFGLALFLRTAKTASKKKRF